MFKRLFLLVTACLLIVAVNAQTWVDFSRSEPAAPEVSVITSTTQSVSFEVTIPGIYTMDTIVNGTSFTRLILPDGFAVNPAGSPEIPVLSYKVAIPDCDGVNVSYSVVSQQSMPSCWVYPVSEFVFDQNSGDCGAYIEQFTFDPVAYAQPRLPEPTAAVSSTGAIRAQKYVEVTIQAVEFCPVTQQLSVIDKVLITLNFTNPQGDIRQNVGIFNKVATNAFINYEDDGISALVNDKAFEKNGFTRGNVQWVNLTDTAQACQIVADYLIITVPEFFEPNNPNSQIKRLADHRAWYNGYDIAIVNVEQILSDAVGFYFEGTPGNPNNPEFKREQRLRTFIRRVYEGGHGNHHPNGDGHLAFVCLIGDNYAGNTEGMPTSKDHNATGVCPSEDKQASDYYFTCVTKTGGLYDSEGDLFIGRFSVGDETELENMVGKTLYHEKGPEGGAWREKVGFSNGKTSFPPYQAAYLDFVENILNQEGWGYYIVADVPIKDPTIAYWNAGVIYTQYFGNFDVPSCFDPTTWESMYWHDVETLLANDYKAPFITAVGSNNSGWFDGGNCMAELMTRYSPTRGAVGYIGASRAPKTISVGSSVDINNLRFQECFPHYLFTKHITIAGDLLRTSQTHAKETNQPFFEYIKYGYNLFGDPALNILATGLACEQIPQSQSYPTQRVLNEGDCLEILEDVVLSLTGNGSISVQGGYLIIGDNVKITSNQPKDIKRIIELQKGFISIGNNVTIENVYFSTAISLSDIHFNNVSFTRSSAGNNAITIDNCTFDNCDVFMNNHHGDAIVTGCTFTDSEINTTATLANVPNVLEFTNTQFDGSAIFHVRHKLKATNCDFLNRSDIVATYPVMDISDCAFWKSGIKAKMPSRISGIPIGVTPFTPFVKITGCSFGKTGTFYTGDDDMGNPTYSTSSIMLDQIKEFQITNNVIRNTNAIPPRDIGYPDPPPQEAPFGEGIYLNNAGQSNVNNRLISGNDISKCVTGLHIYGSKATVQYNDIHDNIVGAKSFNNSSASFMGHPDIANGQQFIRDNSSYGVYASQNAFPQPFHYNQITDNNGEDPIMVYYDLTRGNTDPGGGAQLDTLLSAICNYWGPLPASAPFPLFVYPWQYFHIAPIWVDPPSGPCTYGGSGAKSLYDTGADYFSEENYPAAHAAFIELINTYPDDPYAIAALHELFALEQFIDDDYAALHDYYATFTPADSTLFDVADFLATRCNVTLQNWEPAIDWYEDRIENPPSYQDSIFAVIDLGDIHLSMEADSTNLKSGRIGYGRYLNLIPKSRREYEENKAELLATLPKMDDTRPQPPLAESGKKGVLRQNIPNPAIGSTTVVYDVVEEGAVELRLYNQLGQLLQSLPQGTLKPGSYRIEISLAGLPSAMYHYILFVEGEKADAKKLIVN